MRVLNANELEAVAGGDRWGDGGGSSSDRDSYPRPTAEPGLGIVPFFGFFGAGGIRFFNFVMKMI